MSTSSAATPRDEVLTRVAEALSSLTPELRKAAAWVLENPNRVGVNSIREVAEAAGVKPNSLVRMARSVGFGGFDDFRRPFRQEIERGVISFTDRARWLQDVSRGGQLGGLFGELAHSAIANVEETFAKTTAQSLQASAQSIIEARRVLVLGVGSNYPLAENFTYLMDMAVDHVSCIPRPGCSPLDDLSRADNADVLVAMTFKPYRSDVLHAVEVARSRGVKVIGISDSEASPLVIGADHSFVVSAQTPQFFPSTAALMALLESLVAFTVAVTGDSAVQNIESFHQQRAALGFYQDESPET